MTAIREPTKAIPDVEFPAWDQFEHALAAVLAKLAVDTYLVLSSRAASDADSVFYVQFAPPTGRCGADASRGPAER